jgi:hypothetical protein
MFRSTAVFAILATAFATNANTTKVTYYFGSR